jgi:hypothetical protein
MLRGKKMRIRPVNKFIDFISRIFYGKISGICLCPFGIYFNGAPDDILLNHEKIHWRQQVEMLILPFYLWYLVEFLIRRIRQPKTRAYRSLSFEQEAYARQYDLTYLKNRRAFQWISYLKATPKGSGV